MTSPSNEWRASPAEAENWPPTPNCYGNDTGSRQSPATLVLSPSAQLDVLSQISELAERRALQETTPWTASHSSSRRRLQLSRRHAWDVEEAPAAVVGGCVTPESNCDSSASQSSVVEGGNSNQRKRRKLAVVENRKLAVVENRKAARGSTRKPAAQSSNWRTEAIVHDMLDWETCSGEQRSSDAVLC